MNEYSNIYRAFVIIYVVEAFVV